jgi:hypothetical protein
MIALRNNAPDSPNLAFPFDAHVGHNVNACDRKPMNVLIYETRLTFRLIDTPNLKAQTSIPTTLTPKSPVSHFHPSTSLYLISSDMATAPKKKTKRTKPKDDDDDDAAVPEEDDDDDEDANPKAKKPAGAEKDRKVKTTGKADPVPVVDDDDDDE